MVSHVPCGLLARNGARGLPSTPTTWPGSSFPPFPASKPARRYLLQLSQGSDRWVHLPAPLPPLSPLLPHLLPHLLSHLLPQLHPQPHFHHTTTPNSTLTSTSTFTSISNPTRSSSDATASGMPCASS